MSSDKSEAAKTIPDGECPGLGGSWLQFAPLANNAAILTKAADVAAAYAKFDASTAKHDGE